MKTVLCFGDSNTYGYSPLDGSRFSEAERWTGILKTRFNVIEAGLNNRLGFVLSPFGEKYSGLKYFPKVLSGCKNIDIIILAVGTNDLQFSYNICLQTIENGLEQLVLLAKEKTENIVIVPPVILNDDIFNGVFSALFDKSSIEKSQQVQAVFRKVASKHCCKLLDFNKFVRPSNIDGLHYDKTSHKLIAEKIIGFISQNQAE